MTDTERPTIETGTVISGTLQYPDTIPAVAAFLRTHAPEHYAKFIAGTEGDALAALNGELPREHPFWQSEDTDWMTESLWEAMNDIAPEGTYFGAHIGDGADFGFWPDESDEDYSDEDDEDFHGDTDLPDDPYDGDHDYRFYGYDYP